MIELYWLTRLDAIQGWFIAFSVVVGLFCMVAITGFFVAKYDYEYRDSHYEEDAVWYKFWTKNIKIYIPVFIVLVFVTIFIPSTKDAYFIYGVGGAVDYLKQDTTAVKMPHKVIEALDAWVDGLTPKNKQQ